MTIVPLDPSRVLCGVLGDVHGDLPALVAAVDAVRARAAESGSGAFVVVLGDLVDRGPDSAGCAAFAMRLARGEDSARRDARLLFVRGDHDEALSYNAATGLFSSSVEPADWAERLNALPPDDPERDVARDYVGFVRESPAAILLRGEREGVLLAHGGVPHADLLPGLDSLEAVGAPRCDRDFAWCRVASARRKIPNRASLLCDIGLDDISDFLNLLSRIVTGQNVGEADDIQHSAFSIRHFIHGHEHAAPGWISTPLRGGATMWTATTFHAEENLFLPAIRPSVVLIKSHAESAEVVPHAEATEFAFHAESAENTEVVPHAEFTVSAEFVGGASSSSEPQNLEPPANSVGQTAADDAAEGSTPC